MSERLERKHWETDYNVKAMLQQIEQLAERARELEKEIEGYKLAYDEVDDKNLELADRVEKLEKENKWLDGGWNAEIKMREKRDESIERHKKEKYLLMQTKESYRQALEFYANRQAYYHSSDHTYEAEVMQDYGNVARQALECNQ